MSSPSHSVPADAEQQPRPLGGALHSGFGALGTLARALDRIPTPRPRVGLAVLLVCNWLVIFDAARLAVHQGFLYYDGGDSSWYYTSAWVLAHGHIPLASIGYGYSMLIAPLVGIAGANELAGLPLIIFLNALVLTPIALYCVYGIARAIGGLRFAYATVVVWIALPLLAIRYFLPDYHTRYVDVTLPDATGLTAVGDFPSMVCVLVTAYFLVRTFSSRSPFDALTAGLAAGLALGVKPANALFLVPALVALALVRQPRSLGLFVAGLVPSVVALTLWKYRGLGELPLFSSQQLALALGVHTNVPPLASFPVHLGRYLHFNWAFFRANYDGLREFGWSKRLVEWLALAGFVGLARRTISGAVLVGGWLLAYFVIKGGNPNVSFDGGSFFTHVLPALPAFVILCASIVFVIPVWGRRLIPDAARTSWPQQPRSRRTILAIAAFLAVVPIGVIAILPPLTQPAAADIQAFDLYVPANQFPLQATVVGNGVRLHWPRQAAHGAHVAFFVFRAPSDELACVAVAHAASVCPFPEPYVRIVPGNLDSYLDRPPPGSYSYRVALSATGMGPARAASPLLISEAASATFGR